MRASTWAFALLGCAVLAMGSREVESLDRQGLLEVSETAQPSAETVSLTSRIKELQGDIKTIREKKKDHLAKSAEAADAAKTATDSDEAKEHTKTSITHKAKAADLAHAEKQQTKSLVDDTMAQHGTSAGSLSGSASASVSGASASASFSAGGYGGSMSFKVGPNQGAALFDGWSSKWNTMRAKLTDEVNVQHREVTKQMEIVRKAYDKEYNGHVTAVNHAKELQSKIPPHIKAEKEAKASEQKVKAKMHEALHKAREKQMKAVEKKQKAIDEMQKKKDAMEQKVKAFHQNDCGPAKEAEQKAKAEIKRLQKENHKIRTDCEVRAKEMTSKHQEKLTKSQEKTAKETARADALAQQLAAAKARIQHLQTELAAAQAKIRDLTAALHHQKQLTAEQKRLKEAALLKVKDLTAKLAAMTAKYSKLRSTMSHINSVSSTPDEVKQALTEALEAA